MTPLRWLIILNLLYKSNLVGRFYHSIFLSFVDNLISYKKMTFTSWVLQLFKRQNGLKFTNRPTSKFELTILLTQLLGIIYFFIGELTSFILQYSFLKSVKS